MTADKVSFVTFYNEHKIIPVSQDISDLNKHFQRRDSLFRLLGIPPLLVNGRSFLEFGPGSGHNALFTASLAPQKYILVDGSSKGVSATRELLTRHGYENFSIAESLFLNFEIGELFDIVWAEGCIPHQNNPVQVLQHISKFVKNDGIFALTTCNGISYLSEIIRRLCTIHINLDTLSIDRSLEILRPIFSRHLSNLKNMSRPFDDWIIDNIIHPLQFSNLISIPDVINTLDNDFQFYSSSPNFYLERRWYKDLFSSNKYSNKSIMSAYYKNNINLIDYRFDFDSASESFGYELEELCSRAWPLMCQIQDNDKSKFQDFYELLTDISKLLKQYLPITSSAIDEACSWLRSGCSPDMNLKFFPEWWGRGQQYISLIKHDSL
jgi:SAM-dependent methyltransferase